MVSDEQTCLSSGGALCEDCNPRFSDACTDGMCVTTNSLETFCGKDCTSDPCPGGFDCMDYKGPGGQMYKQCVPTDLSCYY